MNKTILLCFVVLALIQHISAECSASSKLIERGDGNSWQENGIPKRIFDLQITNTGTCRIRNSISIDLKLPPGAHIDASWGLNGGSLVTGFYELVPGQSHSGAGFILSGLGTPTVTVLGFTECICPVGPTEPPTPTPEPTEGPTSTPTNKPTSRPTTAPGDGTFYYVGLKFLILTCNASDIRLSVAKNALEAVGSQYDVIDYPTQGTAPFTFTNTDGSGKYYAFISTTELACWTDAQRIQVEAYEQQFRIKVVILYSFPYPTNGVTMSLGIPITAGTLTFAPAMGPCTSSFQYDAHIPISGVYGYPSTISNSNLATPAVYITIEGNQYVIAAFIKYTDGRSRLEFYVDQADWALFPVLLGTAWFEWASNGIFAGARRIEFNAHMDDIFMSTGTFDPLLGEEGFNVTYRITPQDMQETADWQIDLNSRLASGSNFTLTFPFNGATVIENGGYTADPLFLKGKELLSHFIWETHTYTHPYLDNMTYSAVKQEFVKNNVTAAALFDDRQATSPYFCQQSCITPSITGLFSPNALRAMYDVGIRYVVGDNSRKELVPANLYHGIHTTVAVHGYEGLYILPRHATNIYYDASLPEHIVSQFNYRYSAQVGTLTFPQIVARDVDVATKSLLAYRHDPFMFHQANLRFYDESGTRYSLLSYWVEKVIDSITQYTNLPIISRRHDDLAKVYLERESRDACGFSGQLKVEHGSNVAVGLRAQSTNACTFGISGVRASGAHIVNHETYGNEQTTWIQMTAGANFEITFDEGVAPF